MEEKNTVKSLKVRLDAETDARFSKVAEKKGFNKSAVIRTLLKDWLDSQEA